MTTTFAYYCSGHGEFLFSQFSLSVADFSTGYGHATRVSAFTGYLLTLPIEQRPSVHIVSSAPQHVFAESIALGAQYRHAEIDPIVVQPLA